MIYQITESDIGKRIVESFVITRIPKEGEEWEGHEIINKLQDKFFAYKESDPNKREVLCCAAGGIPEQNLLSPSNG